MNSSRMPSASSLDVCGVIQKVDRYDTQVSIVPDPENPTVTRELFPSEKMAKQAKAMLGQEEWVFCQKKEGGSLSWEIKPTGERKKKADALQAQAQALENEKQARIAATKPQRILVCGNGFDFYFGGVEYTAINNQYDAYIYDTRTKVSRFENEKYTVYRGTEDSPFELLISKNGKSDDLEFTPNLVNFDNKAGYNSDLRSDRSGISVVQFEDRKTKKGKFWYLICENVNPSKKDFYSETPLK